MAQITDINKFTQYWKNKFPTVYGNKSDEQIINLIRERYPQQNIPTYDEALQTDTSYSLTENPSGYKEGSLSAEKTEPGWVDSFFLTSDFIPEKWQQEGVLGGMISADFFKQSYNNSMAGMLYRTSKGEDKYDVSESYDPSWAAQAGQFAVGMLSPLDAITMLSTGALGKVAGVAGKATTASLLSNPLTKKTIEKGVKANFALRNKTIGVVAANSVDGALNLGIGGGTFAATHALLQNTSQQRVENPNAPVNINKALKAASNEFLHAAPMFAIAGGVTQGIMGSVYGYSQAFASKNPTYAQKLTQAATSPLARVGTEAALFTSLPSVFGDEEAPKLGTKEWWAALGTNTLVVGGMRAIGSFVEPKLMNEAGKIVPMDGVKFTNEYLKMGETKTKNQKKVVDSTISSLEESGAKVPKELFDKSKEFQSILDQASKTKEQFKKDYEFIKKINNKIDTDANYLNAKQGSKENIEIAKYQQLINDHSSFMSGALKEILDDDIAATFYKILNKKIPNETELTLFKKSLENAKDDIVKNQKPVDDYLAGNYLQSKDGISGGETPLKPPKIKPTRESEISRYVDLLAGEKKVLPKEIIAEPKYQRDIVIPGENILSLRKLKKAYESELKKRPGSPEAELAKTLTTLDVDKLTDLPVFSKKIAGKTPIKDYIFSLKLDKSNEKMLLQGISEFMQTRKSSNSPSNYKIIADYAKWLESKGFKLNQADRNLTDLYVIEQNQLGKLITKNQRSQLNNTLSAFYGAGDAAKGGKGLKTGFAYKYMGTEAKTPSVSQLGVDRGGTIATPEKIALVEPKDYGLIRAKNKQLVEEGSALQGKGKQTVDPLTYDVATELLYNFGSRGKDTFERLFIENIDIKNGVIREWSSGAGQKGAAGPRLSIPLKKLDPELFNKIVKLIGNRKSGNLLKGLDGKNLSGDSVNIINKSIMPKGVNLRGKKGKLTVGDYRKMALTDAFKIGGDKLREFVKLELVKQKKNITQRYTIQDYNANWKKFFDGRRALDKTKTTAVKEKRAKRLPEEEIFQSKGDKVARDKFVSKVMKQNNLNESQLKVEGLNKGVLGEFGEGVIKLQKNIFQPADFYHENLHRLKAFARASNNKGLEKLITRGEKLAVSTKEYKAWKKNNFNRDVEEFLADIAGGKASRMEFTKGVLPKINQFIKQLVSRVKVAFGLGNFKDISNVLAKRVQKGFSTEGVKFARGQVKFKMEGMSESQAKTYGKKVFNEFFKKEELSDRSMRSQIEKYIGDIAQLGENFKLKKANPIEIEQFVSTLRSMEPNVIKRLPNKLGWFREFKNVEKIRLDKNITESTRTNYLKDLGVPEGSMYKATAKQLRDFTEIITTLDDVKTSSTAWIQQRVAQGLVDKKIADRFASFKVMPTIMPVATVIESLGLKNLSQKLYNHTTAKLGNEGFVSAYEKKMQNIYGNRTWDKVKDFTYLFDKERYFDRLKNNYLTNNEKSFINKTFDISVDKKIMTPKKGKAGEIVKEHKKLMKQYKDEFMIVLKEVLNDAQYEKYIKDKPIQWIENNIYVQRRLTKEAKLALDPDGKQYKEMIKKQEDAVAEKLTKKYFDEEVKVNYKKEQFEKKKQSFIDDGTASTIARANISELAGGFNSNRYSPNFYKNRHAKLPEKIKVDGKLIETYERSYGSTTKDYAIGQSQFLATLEYFPEYIRMKGFKIKNLNEEKISNLKSSTRTRAVGDYLEKAVKEHLKIDRSESMFPNGMRALRTTTSLAAKLQLSAPTSGLKNFLVGNTQSLLAYGYKDYFLGLADAIKKDNRAMVRKTGATEIGMRSIEIGGETALGRFDKVASSVFRLGGMKLTENWNRYISVLAGKRDQIGLARILSTSKEGSRVYNGAVRKLREFYKLSDDEIMLFKEFGLQSAKNIDAKSLIANKRALQKLSQKMDTFAHVNTQGAAINLFMPAWAKSEVAQATLLYKKMAYAATVNTARSMKIAVQNGSLFQPIAFGLGTYFSGEAMIWFYDKFYGQQMPKENSSAMRQFGTTLWKGEFLGILSEALSPFESKTPIDSMYPSLVETASTMWSAGASVITGKSFVRQGARDFFKPAVGLYNGVDKLYRQGLKANDSYASQSKRYSKLYRDYIDEIQDRDEIEGLNETEMIFKQNKYMRAFQDIFNSGYEKDSYGNSLGKWYMMCLFARANDYYYTKFTENGIPVDTPKEALKQAVIEMEESLKNLNPNKAAVTAKDKKTRQKQKIKGINFINWLNEKQELSKGLTKLNNQYAYRYNLVKKSMAEYIKKGNLEKDLKYYDISIRDILK